MKTKINEAIKKVLQQFEDKYFIENVVNKGKVIQDLDRYHEPLLEAFISNETIKKNFTIDIAGNIVMQTNKLIELFEADEYWQDSYTKYSKKIGLTADGKFIDESTDVVLDFPYKDTVLKASMSKEDTDKDDIRTDEPFLNEVIAKEEIDVLLDKKILVNAKKYDENGIHKVVNFNEEDNLILKGNNLLALHSLKEKYAGKIKLIYIDPPYNTGSDSFVYNDNFNHASWLTFMKNRLDIAWQLLSKDGYIVIQTDDAEQPYLKILVDSIYGRNNYVNTVSLLFKNIAGASGGGQDKRLKKNIEYLTIYSKNYDEAKPFNNVYNYTPIHELVQQMKEDNVSWKYTSILKDSGEKIYLGSTFDGGGNEIKIYKRKNFEITSVNRIIKDEALTEKEVYNKYGKYIFTTAMPQSSIRTRVLEKYSELENEPNDLLSIEYIPRTGRNKGQLYEQFYRGEKMRLFAWLSDVSTEIEGVLHKSDKLGTFWNYVSDMNNVNKEGSVSFDNGKKPERLLKDIITMATDENDLVLDFFMGSSTTQAVAHKMNRRYIGIEQMDYINTVSVPRLQNVIKGEQSGVSKDLNWQGGGSFVYVELMEKNRGFLTTIQNAETTTEMQELFTFMLEEAEIDFRVDLEKIKDTLAKLSLTDQKKTLIRIIDKNQLYYNHSEIDDEYVRDLIDDNDYSFNNSFYSERDE